jgi:glycosyltransferase involved in cell wall biosynthesis
VFPERDADALADAIRRILADADLREEFARVGRRRVEENYSWDRVASKTYELYRQILRRQAAEARNTEFEFAA